MGADHKMGRSRHGFTLVELAIVIAILALIAVVAIPRYQDMVTEALYSTSAGVGAAITEAETIREMRLHGHPSSSSPPLSPQELKDQGLLTSDFSVVCPAGGTLQWMNSAYGMSWSLVCDFPGHSVP